MTRRLTETEKWRDKWFRKLPKDSKLMFLWLCDNVDHAGFIELDDEQIEWETGLTVSESKLALTTLSEGKLPKASVSEGKLGYLRVIVREGICWVRNRVKIQCGSTNLSTNANFHKGCIKRFLENEEVFPEPLKVYTVDSGVSYPKLASLTLHKNKSKYKSKNKGGCGGDEVPEPESETAPEPRPDPDAAEISQHKGKDPVFDALIAGGVQIGWAPYRVTSRLAGDDIDWEKIVEAMLRKQASGGLAKPEGYMAALVRSPDFKLTAENGGVDEDGHTAAWNEQADQINDLYTSGQISADGVREMHRQHHKGVDHDIAAYKRGEGELQAKFPMEVAEVAE